MGCFLFRCATAKRKAMEYSKKTWTAPKNHDKTCLGRQSRRSARSSLHQAGDRCAAYDKALVAWSLLIPRVSWVNVSLLQQTVKDRWLMTQLSHWGVRLEQFSRYCLKPFYHLAFPSPTRREETRISDQLAHPDQVAKALYQVGGTSWLKSESCKTFQIWPAR